MATPQRQAPGAWQNTPAPIRPQVAAHRPPAFRLPSNPAFQRQQQPQPAAPATTNQVARPVSGAPPLSPAGLANQTPVQRAGMQMNQKLALERQFPDLGAYIQQGISSGYEIPESSSWSPFEKARTFDIPDRIFEQLNSAQLSTKLGLFSELHHAWVTTDNVLYLWDYTHANPELVGWDDLTSTIQEVKLAKPKAGVFRADITHVLLVATVNEIAILALAASKNPSGVTSVELYQTDLRIQLKGAQVSQLAASASTGRVFFGCRNSNDVCEITYQKEEKWFSNKCGKINHTTKDVSSVISPNSFLNYAYSSVTGSTTGVEHVRSIELDDSRDLVYVLSSISTIRIFHMKEPDKLSLIITRRLNDIMNNVAHMVPGSNWTLFPKTQRIASISPIPRNESRHLALLAITVTGVRLYLSVTSTSLYYQVADTIPSSMQVQHIKFPPPLPPGAGTGASGSSSAANATTSVDTESASLNPTYSAIRYSPGFHFWFFGTDRDQKMFISAPDSGRLGRARESQRPPSFTEVGQWVELGAMVEDVGLASLPFSASNDAEGFGNELAVQFDQPVTEVAILSNSGIDIFRRRRLVDTFSSVLRTCATDEDFDKVITQFILKYTRPETCACALAVACGQGLDAGSDARILNLLTDREVIEFARRTVTEHGGRPEVSEVLDPSHPSVENVRPSSRAQALIEYTSRLVRSAWTGRIIKEVRTPAGGLSVSSTVPIQKLQSISSALASLKSFLDANRTYIPGLNGPEEMNRVTSVTDRTALQGEHQILDAQVKAINNIIEGIAFLVQLFEQPVDEIFMSLTEPIRDQLRQLTYEALFTSEAGKSLAKELVKAIVNRSIAAGSNVDTVADALRRRCGSFCSADDVVIFKAQENLQKAIDAGGETANGRALLNDSLKLFERVAASLSTAYLRAAVEQYVNLSFYAGAIKLCLTVAQQRDRANRALAWIRDGKPDADNRVDMFDLRMECYQQIWNMIEIVDAIPIPANNDTVAANLTRRKEEAYGVIDMSEDEVFQNCLYDWYLSRNLSQRLLDLNSPFVVAYLQRRSESEADAADLLWKYHVHHHDYFEAAKIQLQLAKSAFNLDLQARMEYLSRAKANASTRTSTYARRLNGTRQEVLREISDQLDCSSVQLDVLRRLENDDRLADPNRTRVLMILNGQVLSLDTLYNDYVSLAGYSEIALVIFQLGDFRNSGEIRNTWNDMIQYIHQKAEREEEAEPYVRVQERVRALGHRVNCSETVFNPHMVLQVLSTYILQPYAGDTPRIRGPKHWPVELLLELGIPLDTVLTALETMVFNEAEWSNMKRRVLAVNMLYVCQQWIAESESAGAPLGGVEAAEAVLEALRAVHETQLLAPNAQWNQRLADALRAVQTLF